MDIEDKEEFFRAKGLSRLNHLKRFDRWIVLLSVVAAIVNLVFSVYTFGPKIWHFLISLIPAAHAAEPASQLPVMPEYKSVINLIFMLFIGIAFVWSLAVCLHSDNEGRVKTAGDINKMLLGFLIGSGKSFLGF